MPAPKGHPPYNVNGEGGRPEIYTNEVIEKMAEELLEWIKKPDNIFFDDFCLDQDINPDYMSVWAQKNKRFLGAYEVAKKKEANKIKKGALTKDYDGGFAKFLLINNHGMAEKTESKISSDNPLAVFLQQADGKSKKLVNDE